MNIHVLALLLLRQKCILSSKSSASLYPFLLPEEDSFYSTPEDTQDSTAGYSYPILKSFLSLLIFYSSVNLFRPPRSK